MPAEIYIVLYTGTASLYAYRLAWSGNVGHGHADCPLPHALTVEYYLNFVYYYHATVNQLHDLFYSGVFFHVHNCLEHVHESCAAPFYYLHSHVTDHVFYCIHHWGIVYICQEVLSVVHDHHQFYRLRGLGCYEELDFPEQL